VPGHLLAVDACLQRVRDELAALWAEAEAPDSALDVSLDGALDGALDRPIDRRSVPTTPLVDVLGAEDLPRLLGDLLESGGKRFRPIMCHLGWVAAGGAVRGAGQDETVRISAALELLHAFVLVHDDVMDESATRRGRPTAHERAAGLHSAVGAAGDARRFGESIAVLVGDLAHAEADALVASLPAGMRRIWRQLVIELVAGQRRDLVGTAANRRDLDFAGAVARMKSGRYTVQRPLQLGAVAAGGGPEVVGPLLRYGEAIGEAFALRDDLLGIDGDPVVTGKPSGDDLITGKPTTILALADQRLRGPAARRALAMAGTPAFDDEALTTLRVALVEEGVVGAVEEMIDTHVRRALTALQDRALHPDGVGPLQDMAVRVAWRDR
jgi:geranylgeranyl diphosphate synthase type I